MAGLETRGIGKHELRRALGANAQNTVAGGLRFARSDADFLPYQGVEQRAFADVGFAHDGDQTAALGCGNRRLGTCTVSASGLLKERVEQLMGLGVGGGWFFHGFWLLAQYSSAQGAIDSIANSGNGFEQLEHRRCGFLLSGAARVAKSTRLALQRLNQALHLKGLPVRSARDAHHGVGGQLHLAPL